ncbi:zf-HC2 domain-containing protein, partial [bacterium]|nr:zf-HC2 domain-containing protein [bacterium]
MSTREDMSGACEFEEELPLLLYRGELDPLERARLREHVALCARCEDAFAELEAAAEALDAAPLVHPSPERWAGLKESVLRSLGDAPAVAPCVSFQEDLLALIQHSPKANAVVDEVDAPRREAIVAHLQDCKSCKEAMGAYSAVATALSSEPIEWPTAERWDALKPAILAAVAAPVQANAVVAAPAVARSGSSAELSPARVGLARRRALPTLARIAAAVLILAGGSFLVETMRGLSPDEIRNLKREADTTTDIERAKRDYELVERAGARKPALAAEVEDARAQLVALTRCERALSQKDGDARRVELLNVISQFPDSHATEIALTKYREELGLD